MVKSYCLGLVNCCAMNLLVGLYIISAIKNIVVFLCLYVEWAPTLLTHRLKDTGRCVWYSVLCSTSLRWSSLSVWGWIIALRWMCSWAYTIISAINIVVFVCLCVEWAPTLLTHRLKTHIDVFGILYNSTSSLLRWSSLEMFGDGELLCDECALGFIQLSQLLI